MPVLGLDHVNIRTRDPAATMAFFRDILQMDVTVPVGRGSIDQGGWVLDEHGAAVVHVAGADQPYPSDQDKPFTPTTGSGAIHHVALRCAGYEETKRRLQASSVRFRDNHVPQIKLNQLFVEEPTGILFELNFPEQ